MEKAYFIFSPKRHNTILFSGLFICLLLIKPLSQISGVATLLSLVFLLPTFLLARHFGRAEAIISIAKDKIHLDWTRNYLFKKEQNFIIEFCEIKDWAVDIWNDFYYFRFTTTNGRVLKLSLDKKNGNVNNYEFFHQLGNVIQKYNLNSKTNTIGQGKTFFQRPLAKVFAFIAAGAIVFGWTSYFLTDNVKLFKLVFATIFLGSHIIFTIMQNRK